MEQVEQLDGVVVAVGVVEPAPVFDAVVVAAAVDLIKQLRL
jgi:hypothetical protein